MSAWSWLLVALFLVFLWLVWIEDRRRAARGALERPISPRALEQLEDVDQ